MKVSKDFEFDMAHRLPNHGGLCRNLHGHRYKVRLTFLGQDTLENADKDGDADEGMVVDFKEIKSVAKPFFDDVLDHSCMLSKQYDEDIIQFLESKGLRVCGVDFVPTAENMAQWIYEELAPLYEDAGILLRQVTVWETPTSFAEFKMSVKIAVTHT